MLANEYGVTVNMLKLCRIGRTYKWLNDTIPPHRPGPKTKAQPIVADAPVIPDAVDEPQPAIIDNSDVAASRRQRALHEGGVEALKALERKLIEHRSLSDDEHAKLHRLRIGLRPKVYASMRGKTYGKLAPEVNT